MQCLIFGTNTTFLKRAKQIAWRSIQFNAVSLKMARIHTHLHSGRLDVSCGRYSIFHRATPNWKVPLLLWNGSVGKGTLWGSALYARQCYIWSMLFTNYNLRIWVCSSIAQLLFLPTWVGCLAPHSYSPGTYRLPVFINERCTCPSVIALL